MQQESGEVSMSWDGWPWLQSGSINTFAKSIENEKLSTPKTAALGLNQGAYGTCNWAIEEFQLNNGCESNAGQISTVFFVRISANNKGNNPPCYLICHAHRRGHSWAGDNIHMRGWGGGPRGFRSSSAGWGGGCLLGLHSLWLLS